MNPNVPRPDAESAADHPEQVAAALNVDMLVHRFLAAFHGAATTARVQADSDLAGYLGRPDLAGETIVFDRLARTVAKTSGRVLATLPDDLLRMEEGSV